MLSLVAFACRFRFRLLPADRAMTSEQQDFNVLSIEADALMFAGLSQCFARTSSQRDRLPGSRVGGAEPAVVAAAGASEKTVPGAVYTMRL